jgi:hypothetical protein
MNFPIKKLAKIIHVSRNTFFKLLDNLSIVEHTVKVVREAFDFSGFNWLIDCKFKVFMNSRQIGLLKGDSRCFIKYLASNISRNWNAKSTEILEPLSRFQSVFEIGKNVKSLDIKCLFNCFFVRVNRENFL